MWFWKKLNMMTVFSIQILWSPSFDNIIGSIVYIIISHVPIINKNRRDLARRLCSNKTLGVISNNKFRLAMSGKKMRSRHFLEAIHRYVNGYHHLHYGAKRANFRLRQFSGTASFALRLPQLPLMTRPFFSLHLTLVRRGSFSSLGSSLTAVDDISEHQLEMSSFLSPFIAEGSLQSINRIGVN